MAMVKTILLAAVTLLGLASLAAADTGTATFYTPPYVREYLLSHLVGSYGLVRAACGRRYSVTCTGRTNLGVLQPCRGSVVVTIVDYCPAGCAGTIDLSQEAFAIIADPNAGKVQIEYHQ
ncbi:EG45-like domain containing protein [Acorus calamus]|uniref:EG45-like domain containing protein n=1 Tax=Acorus calamus TaxID=4465 RepID=A0AAV9F9T2_ACOCL|nr:EG45-like domain containing protein [Acorus calamus]